MIYKDQNEPEDVLSAPLLAALSAAVTPDSPPPERAERMRLLDKVRTDAAQAQSAQALANAFVTLRGSTQPGDGWIEMLPKAHARLLFTDGEAESYMIRLEPGAWAPAGALLFLRGAIPAVGQVRWGRAALHALTGR